MPASCDANAFCCSMTLRTNAVFSSASSAKVGRLRDPRGRLERRDVGHELTDGGEGGELRRLDLLEGVQRLLLELADGLEVRCHVLTIPSTC